MKLLKSSSNSSSLYSSFSIDTSDNASGYSLKYAFFVDVKKSLSFKDQTFKGLCLTIFFRYKIILL